MIIEARPIGVCNFGRMRRDVTFISGIVAGTAAMSDRTAAPVPGCSGEDADLATSSSKYRVCNWGRDEPVDRLEHLET